MKIVRFNRTGKRSLFFVTMFAMFILATAFTLPAKKSKVPKLTTPPGTIEIADGLFCDETESSNLDYREFLYWIRQAYGSDSEEYKQVLPDTTVWNDEKACLHRFSELYLRHPKYEKFPVIGVSQNQARMYSQWRSDRVMEFWLVKNGFIETYKAPSREDGLFTIEAYFKGELSWVKPSPEVQYYPEYRLPTAEERKLILQKADDLFNSKERSKKQVENLVGEIICGVEVCTKEITETLPMKANNSGQDKNLVPITNLQGNVAEWSSEDGIAFGGSWKDSKDNILASDAMTCTSPSADLGFRNVCEWKKWGE